MKEHILIIDEPILWRHHKELLEEKLRCKVDVVWPITTAKNLLDAIDYDLVIIEPDTIELEGSHERGEFVKKDLRNRNIPFIVSSLASQEELLTRTGIKAGKDYHEYLKRPYKFKALSDKIAKLSSGKN